MDMKCAQAAAPSVRMQPENLQYRIGSAWLLLFSAPFIVWQMGILYFSGTTMSLFGRTPIPLTQADAALAIAAGYLASLLLLFFLPRKAIYMERIVMPAALAATLLMLFPFPPSVISVLLCISVFVCVFSIGTMCALAAQQFTVETTWRDGIISMVAGGVLIALLQNDVCRVSYTAFTVISVFLIAAQTVFYYRIPANIKAPFVSRESGRKMPVVLFIGVWLISGFSTLLICLASAFAESVCGGVSALYLSAAALAALMYPLRKRLGAGSIRVFGGFFALAVFGFVLAFLSLHIPALQLVACILLGFIVVLANLWIYFAAVSFRVYPTRWIGVIGAGTGLLLAALHSGLLEALRDRLALLYGIYAALSVALLLVYYFLEPYFLRMWSRKADPTPLASRPSGGETPAAPPPGRPPHPFDVLSEQERILAELILDGHTETSAASMMNISVNTQKGYRKNIYFKLDIHSKRELFALANRKA